MRRYIHVLLSLLAVMSIFAVSTASADASTRTRGTVFMKVKAAHAAKPRTSSNLYYHGGAIEQSVRVVIIYWGTDWNSTAYASAKSYIEGFFSGVGGSQWANSTAQYCSGVANGTVQCGGAGTHPTNPSSSATVVYDANAVPSSPTQSQIAAQATSVAVSIGNDANTNYMVFTPSGHSQSGFGTSWCAYHSSSGSVSYSYMPYMPDAGASCGQNFVNSAGQFDGFSIVGGHEYAETITDPYPSSGWLDGRGNENGDKCAWISSGQGAAANAKLSTGSYAVQSLWSNAFNSGAGGCVLSYP